MTTLTKTAVELYIVLDGVENPVRPEVARLGQSKFDIRRYTQDASNGEIELDNSRTNNRIAYALQSARSDRYDSLARSQPLVKAGKMSVDAMKETLGKFDDAIWKYRWIWGELMDSQPQLRGLKLPKGKNALLYRGPWTVKGDYDIDVSKMDPERDLVPVLVPQHEDAVDQEWMNATDATPNTEHYPANLRYAKENLKGLNALGWGFWVREGPYLSSYGGPEVRSPIRGALLGSRLSVEEIVEKFERIEPRAPQQPQGNAYEATLSRLAAQLTATEKKYNELGEVIGHIKQTFSDLIKPRLE